MSTETQPSEHATATARYLFPMGASIAEKSPDGPTARRMIENAQYIDQHAIAPAVAERDRRIAELEITLKTVVMQLQHAHWMAERGNGPAMLSPDVIARAEQILAKHGGAHE